ncbi:hypothetical protein [Nocardioides sp.]|uniref:hypothetical protein n=1 Tax=Nocardioides sp. TaxID=35761 RepID=UPI0025F8A29C|nr:hypothetical protein [Nocardioides sp.]
MNRRAAPAVMVLVAAVLVVGLGSGVWVWGSSRAISDVEVAWRGAPECTGTRLEKDHHTIRAQPGMACVITVEVHNTGRRGVQLDSAVLPYLGPGGGAVVRAGEIDGRTPIAASVADDIDARVELDHHLDAGETWTLRTLVVFRADGCTDAGAVTFYEWPALVVRSWGRDGTVASPQDLVVSRERQNPGCRMR